MQTKLKIACQISGHLFRGFVSPLRMALESRLLISMDYGLIVIKSSVWKRMILDDMLLGRATLIKRIIKKVFCLKSPFLKHFLSNMLYYAEHIGRITWQPGPGHQPFQTLKKHFFLLQRIDCLQSIIFFRIKKLSRLRERERERERYWIIFFNSALARKRFFVRFGKISARSAGWLNNSTNVERIKLNPPGIHAVAVSLSLSLWRATRWACQWKGTTR